MGLSLKKLKKQLTKNMPFKEGVEKAIPVIGKARRNINKKGFRAFTLGQLSGKDRAREMARRAEADAAAEDIPVSEENLKPVEIPTMNMAEIQDYRRKRLLAAQARGGRRSTIMSDKDY